MRYIFILILLLKIASADTLNIDSFTADFQQTITDDKGHKLLYSGKISALKPQYAKWSYETPVKKDVYISTNRIIIVEPEIEQVIIRDIHSSFDFFSLISHAKKIADNKYIATYQESKFIIELKNSKIESLSYKDNFDNSVKIIFSDQVQNSKILKREFKALYPLDYDIIRD